MSQTDDEQIAAQRYMIMNGTRVAGILGVIAGLAMARGVIDAPYWLGVGLSVSSMVAFFFAPPLLAKRWKARDRGER